MIRDFKQSDMEAVINIWLSASIRAHDFVAKEFWQSKVTEMREIYIPGSESYVYEDQGVVKGFLSLFDNTIAAIFVLPDAQGAGIGKALIQKSKAVRTTLNLNVYKENTNSVEFYLKCGFKPMEENIDEHTGHTEVLMAFTGEHSNPAT